MVEGKLRKLSQVSDTFITAINTVISKLTTATYTVNEYTNSMEGDASILVKPTTGNANGVLTVQPKGISTVSLIDLFNDEDDTDSASLSVGIDATETRIFSVANGIGTALKLLIGIFGKTWTFETSGALTAGGPLIFNSTHIFLSTEQTANGGAQNVAHGLGRTPKIFFAFLTGTGAAAAITYTADGTNVTVTATNLAKYRVIAF